MNTQKPKLKIIPLTDVPVKMKCFGLYLTKHIKDLYTENYKKLTKLKKT